jgi:hypothetical protein
VIGHLPLLALRRKGRVPPKGVRVDLGYVDPAGARNWHRPAVPMPCAVVWVQEDEPMHGLDLRFCHAMETLLAIGFGTDQARCDAAIAAVLAAGPSSLVVVALDDNNRAADAVRLDGDGWQPINAERVALWNC